MDQLIRKVTTSITNQLSGDKPFFTPDDLREYDIPEFLIQRVEIEIYRNLNDSVVPPHSEWADMSARDVEQAWEQFIEAIVAEVRMPASFAATVFETAIADVLEMILQPRKAIPEILFGPKKKLSRQEVEKQTPSITVNSHLAEAVYRYMQRKGLNEIEIGTARRVVMKVDERITANYNSLNWAQLLQPLFILAGPKIDTELFRIFFRDRNMDRISRRFDLLSGSLNKIEFIETLSSPDLLNEEGYEDDQVSLFDIQQAEKSDSESPAGLSAEKSTGKETPEPYDAGNSPGKSDAESTEEESDKPGAKEDSGGSEKPETNDPADGVSAEPSTTEKIDFEPEQEEGEDSLAESYQDRSYGPGHSLSDESQELADNEQDESEFEPEIEQQGDDVPLYSRFDEGEDEGDNLTEVEEEEDRFVDQFLYGGETDSDHETDETGETGEEYEERPGKQDSDVADSDGNSVLETEPEINADSNSDEISEDDNPIWQSFLSDEENIDDDDIPEYSGYADMDEEDDDADSTKARGRDNEYENEEAPLIDLTEQQGGTESAEDLIDWLKDDEERFTSHIFSGSEKAYEEALIDLNQLDNWKQASRFIEKEIFARNLVDMYDEEAVDFTDRLQAYFDEYKS